jgi:KEOPS complex subunit Cgi121
MKINVGDQVVSILGFRDITIVDVNNFLERVKTKIHPTLVQIFDASRIASSHHLFFAYLNAKKAHDQKRRISDNLEMEILLYASGQRQIVKAINMIGVKPQTSTLGIILSASSDTEVNEAEETLRVSLQGIQDDGVLEVKEREKIANLQQIYAITQREVEAMLDDRKKIHEVLTWLIVERTCLLSLNR